MSGDLFGASRIAFDRSRRAPAIGSGIEPVGSSPLVPASLHRSRDGNELCRICGEWGAFGFDVAHLKGKTGRYACFAHRTEVERMAA